MSFAENLRAAMDRAGVSQSELGRRLGIRSQAVNQWLRPGGTAPRGARLHQVAAALGVGLSELLAEAVKPPRGPPTPPGDQERIELLTAYDAMSDEQRRALLTVAKGMVPQCAPPPDQRTKRRACG